MVTRCLESDHRQGNPEVDGEKQMIDGGIDEVLMGRKVRVRWEQVSKETCGHLKSKRGRVISLKLTSVAQKTRDR